MNPEPAIRAAVGCDVCGASPGERCIAPSGQPSTLTHHRRWLAWQLTTKKPRARVTT